ncbi:MAG: 30S ribosomal protein S12 methylthiotransferase RimO [Clostridia bacterium]|nr:30S ribosomal protein S12 methylthiotransferase RimO [Clostridia bacterium]
MVQNKSIGVISLGCDKNRVDTEKMIARLKTKHTITPDIEKAEIIIVNTCAFLESSRKEAIEEILSAYSYKKGGEGKGVAEKLIVTGCLPQRFISEIFNEFTEVDAFLGISDYDKINEIIDALYDSDKRLNAVGNPSNERLLDRTLTTNGYAYLKIADGCSNHCTYCLIPSIRGKYRSVPSEMLLKETKALGEVNELILVAQDTTAYGVDLNNGENLVSLIRTLSALDNVKSIRLLYCYPENITEELIDELATNPKLIKYIDIPMQHADDKILKLMNRKGTFDKYLSLVERLKERVKGIAIRSTFITGFPQEDEKAFNNLVNFLERAKLFNAGFFKYSREEGTAAARLSGQIDGKTKTARLKKLYAVQKKIVKQNYKDLVGKTFNVVCEGFDNDQLVYYGRAYFNAPDIDGTVYFFSADETVCGATYPVKIIKATGYDLYGERQ